MKQPLFSVLENDLRVYEQELKDFLPDNIIDFHTHVWLDKFKNHDSIEGSSRTVSWPSLVAKENSIEDLMDTYQLLFPSKKVFPLIFSWFTRNDDFESMNDYIAKSAKDFGVASLLYSLPEWTSNELLHRILVGKHLGIKVYLNLSPNYIPSSEIRIFDYAPHHQLELLNEFGMILMLHIPRDKRLGDPVNIAQILEIEAKYPNINVIYAHIGRAYCPEDYGTAFEALAHTKKLKFDFSATTNDDAIEKVINVFGHKRLVYGSDLPILRMKMRRICENGKYINLVARGCYKGISTDPNMREIEGVEASKLTFFLYEELLAFKRVALKLELSKEIIEDIFYLNAKNILIETCHSIYGSDTFLKFNK